MAKNNDSSEVVNQENSGGLSSKPKSVSLYGFFWKAILQLIYTLLIVWAVFHFWGKDYLSHIEQTIKTVREHTNVSDSIQNTLQKMSEDLTKLSRRIDQIENHQTNSSSSSSEEISRARQEIQGLSNRLDQYGKTASADSTKLELARILLQGGEISADLFSRLPHTIRTTLSATRDFPKTQEILEKWLAFRATLSRPPVNKTEKNEKEGWWEYLKAVLKENMKIQRIDKNFETLEATFIHTVEQTMVRGDWANLETFLSLYQDKFPHPSKDKLLEFLHLVAKKSLGEKLLMMAHQQND